MQTVRIEQEVLGFGVHSDGPWPDGLTLRMTLSKEQAEGLVQVVMEALAAFPARLTQQGRGEESNG